MFRSIRWRIAFSFGMLILALMALLGAYLSRYVRTLHTDGLEERMAAEARLAASALAQQWDALAGQPLDGYASAWAQDSGARVTIVDAAGVVLGESDQDRQKMENHLDRPEIQQARQTGLGTSIRLSSTLASNLLYVAVPVQTGSETAAYVRLAYPLRELEASIRRLQGQVWAAVLGAALLAVGLAFGIAALIARPIVAMTAHASRVAHAGRAAGVGRTADASLAAHGPEPDFPYLDRRDEVGQLAQALDRMARQLQERIEALQSEQVKLSAVLSQMTDGVIIVDPQGSLALLNPSAEGIFNVASAEVVGRSIVRALGYHQLHELWAACRAEGREKRLALELTHQRRLIQVVATPLGGEMQDYTLLLCQDLTSIRRLETVRRDFISNISHELRTPLASLRAIAETLQLSAIDEPETARHFLGRMETEIDALTQMVNELLELARIESGRVPLELKPVDAAGLCRRAAERLQAQAERAGLAIILRCPEALPAILADGSRLEQVLVNLIHNAIKFTPPGGAIIVLARQEGEAVCFAVQDTGVGIAPEMLPRVFERFYKTDQARSGGGTGLGLSIARHLVEAHKGRIWAESRLGEGSTFYFTIPRAPA